MTRKRLRFEGGPISVYVSLHNPGGALAMRALQEGFHEAQARNRSRLLSLTRSTCIEASAATLPGTCYLVLTPSSCIKAWLPPSGTALRSLCPLPPTPYPLPLTPYPLLPLTPCALPPTPYP